MQEKHLFRFCQPWFVIGLWAILATGCGDVLDRIFVELKPPGPSQPLVVGLTADPVFQQVAPDIEGQEGFSRDLAKAFAGELGVELKPIVVPNAATLLKLLKEGRIHMALGLPIRSDDPAVSYSVPIRESRPVIVQHASARPLDSPARLAGRAIAMLPGTPYAALLNTLKIEPPPVIVERQHHSEIELLADVARQRLGLAATDDLHFAIATSAYPDLEIALTLPGKLACGWAFPAADGELRVRADRFLTNARTDGTLRRLEDRYFGHIRRIESEDMQAFLAQVRTRLPHFRHMFEEAQEITGIDWRLLAVLAYQESQWDPLATSPTGVRGMMMLTKETADRLGVTNRLDARQSIIAGAKYLAMLMDELPEEIKPPDRLWFALAAYNLGMGHLNGGRYFAPRLERDPNLWVDMKEVLPLLARPEYYERLKSGRARGGEAVIMVENIRNYFDVLARFAPVYTPPSLGGLPPPHKKAQRIGASASNPPR